MHFGEGADAALRELTAIYGTVRGAQTSLYFIRPEETLYRDRVTRTVWPHGNAQPGGEEISRTIDAAAERFGAEFRHHLRPRLGNCLLHFAMIGSRSDSEV
jgi:hypothetical protein